MPGGWAREE